MELSLEDLAVLEDLKALRAIKLDKNYLDDLSDVGLTNLLLLQEKAKCLTEKTDFEVGDLVKWKRGMKNRKFPGENEFGVVTGIVKEPIFASNNDSGSNYFREPLDIIIGVLDSDKTLVNWHLDSRRLRKVIKEE